MTSDLQEASRLVAGGTPVVLVGGDAEVLGQVLAQAPDKHSRERLLAVMVGDLADPVVGAAAREMAAELWPWATAASGPPAG